MPELSNPKRELFCKFIAAGKKRVDAYKSAGYESKTDYSATQSAGRLMLDAAVKARIQELREPTQEKIAANVAAQVDAAIMETSGRLLELVERHGRLKNVIAERAEFESRTVDAAGNPREVLPGAATGLIVTSYKAIGNKAIRTHEVDFKLLQELRDIERQIAIERKQWMEKLDLFEKPEDGPDDLMKELAAAIRTSPTSNPVVN